MTAADSNSLVATPEKKSTSGHMSLMTVALNFFRLQPAKRGFCATILYGQSTADG